MHLEKLSRVFTNSEVASLLDIKGGTTRKRKIAACMTYSLCQLGLSSRVGKQGNAHVFSIQDCTSSITPPLRGVMKELAISSCV